MTNTTKLTDAQRTALLLDLVGHGHVALGVNPVPEKAMAGRQVFLTEVASATGFANGYADALGFSLWHSDRFEVEGYEIKASRSDLKRELGDLSKWQRIGRYCDRWWLVVWDAKWLDDPAIPSQWGLLAYSPDKQELKVVRKATQLERTEWPMTFIAAVVRRAAEASPCAALLHRMHTLGYDSGRGAGLREERDKHHKRIKELLAPLLPMYKAAGGSSWATEVPLEWAAQELLSRYRTEERA